MLDLNAMTVKNLIGRLRTNGERCDLDTQSSSIRLLVTEEGWDARRRQHELGKGLSSSDGNNVPKSDPKPEPCARKTASFATVRLNVTCRK